MLDIRLIREKPEEVRAALAKRGETAAIDELLKLDEQRRAALREAEDLKARRNALSKQMADPAQRTPSLREETRVIGDRIKELDGVAADLEARLNERLLYLPNLPDPGVPVGATSEDNKVVRVEGQQKQFPFTPQPHWDLGPKLGIIDFDRGTRLSGSRFYVLEGKGAKLQRALIQWMLDLHVEQHGYTEVYPPFMVTADVLRASGQLPKFADNLYHDAEEDFWFIPTAEVPLTSMHRGEILDAAQLPINYVAYTPCFRREKMSAGRDVRGIKRGHQFDKVELYKFVEPETHMHELENLLHDAEDIPRRLGLTYRIVELCTGDLGAAAAKSFDIEVWAPGCQEWLEVSSCSTTADFQARRANIRYRPADGKGTRFVNTLNGSGTALPRIMIAVMETYQNADGSIDVPEALQKYTGWGKVG